MKYNIQVHCYHDDNDDDDDDDDDGRSVIFISLHLIQLRKVSLQLELIYKGPSILEHWL